MRYCNSVGAEKEEEEEEEEKEKEKEKCYGGVLPGHGIAPGLVSLAIPDCGKNDSILNKEMEKQLADLLSEEIKLRGMVAEEHFNRMNLTLGEARKLKTQYQRESEKCNAATETCEQARERAEASLTNERKLTSMWEQRARQLGWQ